MNSSTTVCTSSSSGTRGKTFNRVSTPGGTAQLGDAVQQEKLTMTTMRERQKKQEYIPVEKEYFKVVTSRHLTVTIVTESKLTARIQTAVR